MLDDLRKLVIDDARLALGQSAQKSGKVLGILLLARKLHLGNFGEHVVCQLGMPALARKLGNKLGHQLGSVAKVSQLLRDRRDRG